MSNEEKKAIDFTKYLVNDYKKQLELIGKENKNYGYSDEEIDVIKYRNEQFEILLNLIEKQQKEIDLCEETEIALNNRIMDLEEINKEHQKLNGELRDEIKRQGNTREIEEKYIEENFISKDEIREKIKDLERKSFENEINYSEYYYKTEILKELLEEE